MSPVLLLGAAFEALIPQVVTVIIGFFVTLWILKQFAWGPIIKVIDERRETIAREFETIESKQAHLESQIKDYEERLKHIDNEARERLNKAIEEGRRISGELLEEARHQADDLKKKAVSDIQLEVEKARADLRDAMVRITLGATSKMLKEELNEDRHKRLVTDFISELENRKAS